MKNKSEFWKVLGIGDIDYEFTINMTQAEANFLKFDIDKIKSLQDCKTLLEQEEVRDKMQISSKNNLINLLLFLNKTNLNKTFVEFLSLNCLSLSQDMAFFKEKVKTDFDDNFLFLIESNLISPCKFKLQINVENKSPKIFESETSLDNNPNAVQPKINVEGKKEEVKKETKKDIPPDNRDVDNSNKKNKDNKSDDIDEKVKEEIQKPAVKKEETKNNELKKDEAKQDVVKKEEINKNDLNKKENAIDEPKKVDDSKVEPKLAANTSQDLNNNNNIKVEKKKEESIKDDPNKGEPIKDDTNKEENKPVEHSKTIKPEETPNTEQAKKEEIPKGKNYTNIIPIELPSISRPNMEKMVELPLPEGKGEQYFSNTGADNMTKYNQAIKNNVNVHNSFDQQKSNILYNLKYDYDSVDYIFIDLNKFLTYKEITINHLYEYLANKISNVNNNTSIILIFPNLDNIDQSLISGLIDISSVCDIVIFDKRDAMTLCSHLGYKVEDKNFEVRFMFLKEFKKSKNKRQKTCLFLEDFHKLVVVMQETDTNLIVYHNEFNFEIGFKLDYFRTVTNNNDFLKFVFYGGFFSRVVQNQPFDVAFNVGLETFKKMLDILHNNLPLPDAPEYFLVNPKIPTKVKKAANKTGTSSNFNKKKQPNLQERENKFILDAVSMSNKKTKDSIYAQDSIGNSKKINQLPYGSNPSEEKPKTQNQFYPGTMKSPNMTQTNNFKVIEIEQKKLFSILEANEKIQQKLNKLLSKSPRGKELMNSDYEENDGNKTSLKKNNLPKIHGSSDFKLTQTSTEFNNTIKKKNLKPISKEVYDRLTGNNKNPFATEYKSQGLQPVGNIYNDFVNSSNLLENSPNKINLNNFQSSPIIPEEKKDAKEQNLLNSSVQVVNNKNPQTVFSENVVKKAPPAKPKLVRISKELEPICNLGYIPIVEPVVKLEEKKKNEFRDYTYFDSKFRKNRGFDKLMGEKDKKPSEIVEINKSDNERGRKDDYNDLSRSLEKKKKRDDELERRRKEEQRKLEEKLAEEKRLAEKKRLEEEEEAKLKLEKEEKIEEKKEEVKKEEVKKEEKK